MADRPLGKRLMSWLGRLHPAVAHFPIAMITGAFIAELIARRGRTPFKNAAQVMLLFGVIGAVIAAALGWFAGGFYIADRNPVLMTHRWLGTAIALLSVTLFITSKPAVRKSRFGNRAYWLLLAGLSAAIAVQGYIGGSFMHGGLAHLAF